MPIVNWNNEITDFGMGLGAVATFNDVRLNNLAEINTAFDKFKEVGCKISHISDSLQRQRLEKIETECAAILASGESPNDYHIVLYASGEMKIMRNE